MDPFAQLLADNFNDPVLSGIDLAGQLMAGDRESFKAGYSPENAAYAAQDAFDFTGEQRQEILARITDTYVNRPGEIDYDTGLFDGVYAGAPAEWYVYRWDTSDLPEGYWTPIMGPFASEAAAREQYAERTELGLV